MNDTEFGKQQNELLDKVPEEFRAALSYMAWEQGHSAGYEECLNYLTEYISQLSPCIKNYTIKIKNGLV